MTIIFAYLEETSGLIALSLGNDPDDIEDDWEEEDKNYALETELMWRVEGDADWPWEA